jgi:hypothetical protein
VNIHDFTSEFTEADVKDIWNIIFSRQKELSEKYVPIEVNNGLRWTPDEHWDLDDSKAQAQAKDFAWRVMEEIGESMEAYELCKHYEMIGKDSSEQLTHASEELGDGLHFLVELCLFSGVTPHQISQFISFEECTSSESIFKRVFEVNKWMGITMNCLKNKPWKQTQYPTDKKKFNLHLLNAFKAYIILMLYFMKPLEILDFYFRKSKVNQFRIESNY